MEEQHMNTMSRRILIVNDDRAVVDLVREAFSRDGFSTAMSAEAGFEAIQYCCTQTPDLVILDLMLPDIDGIEVCKQIRAFSHCPILFQSSLGDEVD